MDPLDHRFGGTEGSQGSIHTCKPTRSTVGLGEGEVQVQITPVDPPDETAVPILNIPGGQQILPLKHPAKMATITAKTIVYINYTYKAKLIFTMYLCTNDQRYTQVFKMS